MSLRTAFLGIGLSASFLLASCGAPLEQSSPGVPQAAQRDSLCGNGVRDDMEQCDDGNRVDTDDCTNDCRLRVNGELLLVEPEGLQAGANGILDPRARCASAAMRAGARNRTPVEVRYRIHICQRPDGSLSVPEQAARSALAEARTAYLPFINLVEEGPTTVFRYQDCRPLYEDTQFPTAVRANNPAGLVPIVFVEAIPSTTSAFALGGYASQGSIAVMAGASRTVIAHELGHFFGLGHTHSCRAGLETAAMCMTTGDLICDTPPDRGPRGVMRIGQCADGSWLNGSCDTNGCGIGRCDDGSRPNRDLVMSYYHCWPGLFSVEQADFIRCTLDNELKTFARAPSCAAPYQLPAAGGGCTWNCGVGTVPDASTGQCVCKSGFTETGKDSAGRRTCACTGPYHGWTSDQRCVWSCGSGTRPDDPSNECICQPGLKESGKDAYGRRTCR